MKNNKVKDYRSKKKLNENERVLIEHYYTKKKIKNYSYIAKELGRDRKTIEREIKRNGYSNVWGHWVYETDIAQERTYKRRKDANRKHIKLFTREGRDFIEKIKEAIRELLKGKKVYSITTDNGTEFTDLIDICEELGIKGYRCHPYSSWEKGSIEVHNRYIRRYIPKGADINDYTDEELKKITDKINSLPRKIHGYRTPEEIFYEKTIKYF